jgi:hypothetical protein
MLYPFENNKLYQIRRRAWQSPLARLVRLLYGDELRSPNSTVAREKIIWWQAMRLVVNGELLI